MQKNRGAHARGSVRPRPKSWSTYGAPPLPHEMGGNHGCHHHRRPPPLPPPEEPTVASTTLPTSVADDGRLPLAADVAEEAKASLSTTARTHHGRAPRRAIQAIHHDGDDEHIPDPSRPQADVDHSGHTRRVFLARHQEIQLHPAPIVAHFKSQPMHIFIHIFMDHFVGFDPKINHHKGHSNRFLPELIRPSILPKAHCLHFSSSTRPGSVEPGRSSCWPCSYGFQHVVNVGSAVDDRRFALKAAAKATVPAAIVLKSDFL